MLTITVKDLQDRPFAVILSHEIDEVRSRHVFSVMPAAAQGIISLVEHCTRISAPAVPNRIITRPISHRLRKNTIAAHVENVRHLMTQQPHAGIVARVRSDFPDYAPAGRKSGIASFYRIEKKLEIKILMQLTAARFTIESLAYFLRHHIHLLTQIISFGPFTQISRRIFMIMNIKG